MKKFILMMAIAITASVYTTAQAQDVITDPAQHEAAIKAQKEAEKAAKKEQKALEKKQKEQKRRRRLSRSTTMQ